MVMPAAPIDCCSDERTGAALVPVDVALEKGLALAHCVVGTQIVPLENAFGRVLAKTLFAPLPLPPFDNSGMDGYALRARDLSADGPTTLRVTGRVAAGDDASLAGEVGPGQAFRIFTGAGIPNGADAVIMQEHVTRAADQIILNAPVPSGNNIRLAGEDAAEGSILLPGGTVLGARELGAIASIGLANVTLRRKIRVALFCTGNELRQPGETLAPGQIYNSNRFMMMAALHGPNVDLTDFGAIEDDPKKLKQTLKNASQSADIIVTTGGVSVGEEDHMVAQLQAAGGKIEVMKVAMKPGKPLSIGVINQAIYIGLPGNPVAAFTTWKVIGSRIAKKVAGANLAEKTEFRVELGRAISRRPGRQEYRPAIITATSPSGHPVVELLDHSFSAKISLICSADGFAVIPAKADDIPAGTQLGFVPL